MPKGLLQEKTMTSKLYLFRNYDPLSWRLPGKLEAFYVPLAVALEALGSKSRRELATLLIDIDNHVSAYATHSESITTQQHVDQSRSVKGRYWHRVSIGHLMKEMAVNSSPAHISPMEDLTWSECFACITLGIIAYAANRETYLKKEKGKTKQDIAYHLADYFLGPATEAGTIAGMLSVDKYPVRENSRPFMLEHNGLLYPRTITSANRAIRKEASSKGGLKKAAAQENLIQKVLSLYDQLYSNLTRNKAAEIIVTNHLKDSDYESGGRKLIAFGNESIQVYRWLLKFRDKSGNPK